ncbi:MAG TPA: DUF87 domain-containing protein, partial [Steroidobacteraceae bacterium]
MADGELDALSSILDDRAAIVGVSGSGKTYTAKVLVERLITASRRVCIVDPTGVWWGLRAGADGHAAGGLPVNIFGGLRADIPIDDTSGEAVAHAIARTHAASIVDISEIGSHASRRRFMTAFAETLYQENRDTLHLVLDEADSFAPQKPPREGLTLLSRIDEIVRRGRVRGFIPWLITQRPAVLNKDVLSQADVLIAMKLTSSQDRAAIGGWIEGQADRVDAKRILGDLPRLSPGVGVLWAPGHNFLERVKFPALATYDSSAAPRARYAPDGVVISLKIIDLEDFPALAALTELRDAVRGDTATRLVGDREVSRKFRARSGTTPDPRDWVTPAVEAQVATAREEGRQEGLQCVGELLQANVRLVAAIQAAIAGYEEALGALQETATGKPAPTAAEAKTEAAQLIADLLVQRLEQQTLHGETRQKQLPRVTGELPPAARKLLATLCERFPASFTWTQAATLSGLKASGGHFNAGRKALRDGTLIAEKGNLISASLVGLAKSGVTPRGPIGKVEQLA